MREDSVPGDLVLSWDLAAAAGRRLAPPGPRVGQAQARALVIELRRAAARAADPVAHTARMASPAGVPVLVVDRAGWIGANAASMGAMIDPVLARLAGDGPGSGAAVGPLARAVGSRTAGAEAGALLAWLSTKVLGQLDLAPQASPRLLLVAPNILAAERELGVDPRDFRQWVALHEETHRVQLTGVPWLRGHLLGEMQQLLGGLMPAPGELGDRLAQMVTGLADLARGRASVTDAFAAGPQREAMARITAWMSLLEGHADVVMDDAGPSVVPTVSHIRRRFEQRRAGRGALDRLLRRLLGLEAKMAQYRDGAAFVRGVMGQVGVDGFNAVWAGPEQLPRPREILDPAAWVRRVHG